MGLYSGRKMGLQLFVCSLGKYWHADVIECFELEATDACSTAESNLSLGMHTERDDDVLGSFRKAYKG